MSNERESLQSLCRICYCDGIGWVEPPEHQAVERTYRDAYLAAAREAAEWDEPDDAAVKAAWAARREAREQAVEGIEHGEYRYRPGHAVDAARTRARVQAFEWVSSFWDELACAGVPDELVGPFMLSSWAEAVAASGAPSNVPPWKRS